MGKLSRVLKNDVLITASLISILFPKRIFVLDGFRWNPYLGPSSMKNFKTLIQSSWGAITVPSSRRALQNPAPVIQTALEKGNVRP